MKKFYYLLLLILLFPIHTVTAQRIKPTERLGLFIDSQIFDIAVEQSPLNHYVLDWDCGKDTAPFEVLWEAYYLKNGIQIINLLDENLKITSISLIFPSSYTKNSEIVYTLLGYVLKCTGLTFDEYDEAMRIVRSKGEYVNDSYGITVWEEYYTDEVHADIMSPYWFTNWEETPYSRMKKYYSNCDSNYVGACVPVTNRNLDCKDIGVRNFFIVGNDTHYFDGDNNGICCEPYPEWVQLPW